MLRGRGVPGLRGGGRGDLVVTVVVETPTRLDARQEELLRELAALRGEEQPTGQVAPAAKSVFGRLRDAFNPALMTLPVHARRPSLAGVAAGATVEVDGDEAHHAVAVRRLRVGEQVVLTDGPASSVAGEVASTGKRVVRGRRSPRSSTRRPGRRRSSVVQAMPKGDRGELAVEVLTEVGVDGSCRGRPRAASRSGGASGPRSRWPGGERPPARRPSRPGGRGSPTVAELARPPTWSRCSRGADLAVVLHEAAAVPLAVARRAGVRARSSSWSAPRAASPTTSSRRSPRPGARAVRLGAEVLRTSTAGVAAVAALLARTPRWALTLSASLTGQA